MDRRSFVQSMATAGMVSQAGSPAGAEETGNRTLLYRLDYFYYRQGDQGARISKFLTSQMPLLAKSARALGVFTAVMTPHAQTTLVLSGFTSLGEMAAAGRSVESDSGYQKAHEEFEQGNDNPPYDSLQRVVLLATSFSPEIVPLAEKRKQPRYFELRIYHSPTARQLRMVHERFAGPEIKIFHRSGIHPILYADTIIGPEMPNLTYLTPFASLADREKAWDAFAADPEWLKARDESIARGGQIVNYNNISLWRATAYSPIQ